MNHLDRIEYSLDKIDKTLHGNGREGLVTVQARHDERLNDLEGPTLVTRRQGAIAALVTACGGVLVVLLPLFFA